MKVQLTGLAHYFRQKSQGIFKDITCKDMQRPWLVAHDSNKKALGMNESVSCLLLFCLPLQSIL